MNKTRSYRITALMLAAIAIILLVVGIYGMTRPLSYGLSYYHASFFEGEDFNGTITFDSDNTLVVSNTNFDEELKFFYYYRNGYIFFPLGETQEEFEKEVVAINEDFEGAINAPFYASKITPFRLSSEGLDGYKTVYFCKNAMMMAAVWGAVELTLIGFAFSAVVRSKKKAQKHTAHRVVDP